MTVPVIQFEALKVGFQQTKDGVKLALVVHPDDVPDEIALSPLGARYQCVLVRLGDDDTPQVPQEKKRSWDDLRTSQQAGIAANDRRFQEWAGAEDAEHAAVYIRAQCGVHTRARLDSDPKAGEAWKRLYTRYRQETGQESIPR